jgi:radical SAM superfamily enzyme YgiQ (UPF0313 family)
MTGMSNLGFHFIYSGLARSGELRVERRFGDGGPSRKMPAKGADAVFFSISYEEDLVPLVRMLKSMEIEPLREDRGNGPLVIAGGPVLSSNPVPFFPIADIICAGEGENILPGVIEAVSAHGRDRPSIAGTLENTDGILMPGIFGKTRLPAPVDPSNFQHSVIIAEETVFPGTMLIEISRGCPGACAFCMATSIYRPFRTVPLGRIMELVEKAAAVSADMEEGLKIGLVSTAAAAHPQFVEILDHIIGRGGRVGLSSLRAADMDEARSAAIGRAGIRSVSLAPESGSERIRFDIGKKVPDAVYFKAAGLLRSDGVSKFNLYMLTGLPGEDDRAFDETGRFIGAFLESVKGAHVSVNLNVVVPKPRTPLQFMAMARKDDIRSSVARMREVCMASGAGISVKGFRSAMDQARISLGSEGVGRAAVRFAAGGTSWKRALRDEGVDPDIIHFDRSGDGVLPWEEVFGGGEREVLAARYRKVSDRDDQII